MTIGGQTKLVGVFGDAAGYSLVPAIHNAAFEHMGMDWCCVPFSVSPQHVAQALRALPALGVVGVNITTPLRKEALRAVDEVVAPADLAGAVDTVHCRDGKLVGYNTDVEGFTRSLQERGEDLTARTVVVLGAGGAARAAVVAVAQMGAARIWVLARRIEQGAATAELARRASSRAQGAAIRWEPEAGEQALAGADAVVNATPMGMYPRHDDAAPIPEQWLRAGMLVYDMVYTRERTRLLAAAEGLGCRAVGGRRMLVLAGATAFGVWTGRAAPVEVMQAALEKALAAQRGQ
jgi:shikimate dehydrogenase